jgi:hypothetical protein
MPFSNIIIDSGHKVAPVLTGCRRLPRHFGIGVLARRPNICPVHGILGPYRLLLLVGRPFALACLLSPLQISSNLTQLRTNHA